MSYIVFDELALLCGYDEEAAKKIYELVKSKYPNHDCEKLIKSNMEYTKRNYDRSQKGGFVNYLRTAIEHDYANQPQETQISEPYKTALEELVEHFCIEDIAKEIYEIVKTKYVDYNYEELIMENIKYAKSKQKKVKMRFLQYSREVIENDLAEYSKRQ